MSESYHQNQVSGSNQASRPADGSPPGSPNERADGAPRPASAPDARERFIPEASDRAETTLPPSETDEVIGEAGAVEEGWAEGEPEAAEPTTWEAPRLTGNRKGRRLVKRDAKPRVPFNPQQRLLILDSWLRSGLPAGDFATLVGVSKHTLYAWKKQFDQHGPAGLMEHPKGVRTGSRLPEVTKRSILMLKQSHPDWGCQRISDMLLRGPALPASASAVARVLHEAGYELEEVTSRPHPDKVRSFERARPNQLWQTDLFTFMLKRQNRRVYLVAFLDDRSRFITGYGVHASASTALVLEVLRAAIGSYGPPEEILTDNGPQYVTWRGKSAFSKELEKQGIRQIVAAPRRPQTLGKIERFWGTLWRECLESATFLDLAEARARIGLFIDWYNFQRCHQGIDGLLPADRYFQAAPAVLAMLKERVQANALELARHGVPKAPFYVTGQVGEQTFSMHAAGERMILSRPGQPPQEIDLTETLASGVPASVPIPARREATGPLPAAVCPHAAPGDRGAAPADEPAVDARQTGWPETARLWESGQPASAGQLEQEQLGEEWEGGIS